MEELERLACAQVYGRRLAVGPSDLASCWACRSIVCSIAISCMFVCTLVTIYFSSDAALLTSWVCAPVLPPLHEFLLTVWVVYICTPIFGVFT